MIAIFDNITKAQEYADKVHAYLLANCPGYNATKWADPEPSANGEEYIVMQPIEEYEQLYSAEPIDTGSELSEATDISIVLPDIGEECIKDKHYTYKNQILICRQTHNRTIYEPKNTPALFSFFRNNTDLLLWIEGEQVEVKWVRIYNEIKYEVIQAHQTQTDWTPPVATTLWKVYVDASDIDIPVWNASDHFTTYTLGDKRIDDGRIWECINVGFSYYQPSSVNGHYGWKYLSDM